MDGLYCWRGVCWICCSPVHSSWSVTVDYSIEAPARAEEIFEMIKRPDLHRGLEPAERKGMYRQVPRVKKRGAGSYGPGTVWSQEVSLSSGARAVKLEVLRTFEEVETPQEDEADGDMPPELEETAIDWRIKIKTEKENKWYETHVYHLYPRGETKTEIKVTRERDSPGRLDGYCCRAAQCICLWWFFVPTLADWERNFLTRQEELHIKDITYEMRKFVKEIEGITKIKREAIAPIVQAFADDQLPEFDIDDNDDIEFDN